MGNHRSCRGRARGLPAAVLLAVALSGCGLPIPSPGSTRCSGNVFLEAGSPYSCEQALTLYAAVQAATGVDLDHGLRAAEFVHGPNLSDYGHPDAIGWTSDNDTVIVWNWAASLYHEALHLDDHSHCNWSVKHLQLFEEHRVPGAFTDDCQNVRCQSSKTWTEDGQTYGTAYECTTVAP